jgi:hypothetical protein
VSLLDVVGWVLAPLAGVALALRIRSTTFALMLSLAVVVTTFVLWGYSWNYPNGACQPGEPCPTADHVIQIANAILFPLGSTLFVVALARGLWLVVRDLKYRRHASPSRDA